MCDELKNIWKSQVAGQEQHYDAHSFEQLMKSRVKRQTGKVMKYFWSAFALELGVFALLSHVMVKYWNDYPLFAVCAIGVMLHIPFLYMLMKKFKAMAVTRPLDSSSSSLYQYIRRRHDLLNDFYQFKRNYERFLIPLSTIIGCYAVFELYIPLEGDGYWTTYWVLVVITIASCAVALRKENKERFEEPLSQFRVLLSEFEGSNRAI